VSSKQTPSKQTPSKQTPDERVSPKQVSETGPMRGCPRNKHPKQTRNIVVQANGWIKEARRIATRYEKNVEHHLAMIYIAIARMLTNWHLGTEPRLLAASARKLNRYRVSTLNSHGCIRFVA
jgi:hypothetical protein